MDHANCECLPEVTVVDYKAIREVDVSSLAAQIAFAHDLARYQPLAKSRISSPRRRMRAADRCRHILACRKEYASPACRRPRHRRRPRWYARQIRRAAWPTTLRWSNTWQIRRATWSTTLRWSNVVRRSVSRRRDNCAPTVTARSIIVWVIPARTTAVIAGAVIAGAASRTTGQ